MIHFTQFYKMISKSNLKKKEKSKLKKKSLGNIVTRA